MSLNDIGFVLPFASTIALLHSVVDYLHSTQTGSLVFLLIQIRFKALCLSLADGGIYHRISTTELMSDHLEKKNVILRFLNDKSSNVEVEDSINQLIR